MGARRLSPLENKLGRYQLVAPLGQGGMGTIHLAVAGGLAEFRKLLVVKELRQELAANPQFIEMFLNEAQLAAKLNHPNVVQTIEAGQDGDRYFLSMEFLDGQPFSALWSCAREQPRVPLSIHLKVLCEALAGLHYAHSLSDYDGTKLRIVHRDVSPQNIFVTYDGQVKVVDFGIARASMGGASTTPGVFKGKFGYAAPEQVRGDAVDARTDVFAMGVILWEVLAQRRFADIRVDRSAVMTRLAGGEPRAAQLSPKVDPRLAAICDRALEVDPAARYASADDFRVALEAYLEPAKKRATSAAIQAVMIQKFAAKREAVHRLIDRHIKHGPEAERGISEVRLGIEVGNNNVTAVADLSKYVSDTHETVVSGLHAQAMPDVQETAATPDRVKPWRMATLAGGLGLALALGAGAMALTRSSATSEPAPVRPMVAAPTPTPPSAPQPPAATVQAVTRPAAEPVNTDTAEPPASPAPDGARLVGRAAARKPSRTRAPNVRDPAAVVAAPHVEPALEPATPSKPAVDIDEGADLNRLGRVQRRRTIESEM